MTKQKNNPTDKEKILQYESFLHKINLCCLTGNQEGISELISNAEIWSYNHRRGNGEIPDGELQKMINYSFWKLCDTPKTDYSIKLAQDSYNKYKNKIE
jgi:hypothetical protein